MARRSTGGVVERPTKRGVSFAIRYRVGGQRQFEHVGYRGDGVTREDAERRLVHRLEQIRLGQWEPPAELTPPPDPPPSFHRFASDWIKAREPELRPATVAVYGWVLTNHLLPFFANRRLDQITVEDVDRYRRAKVREGELSPGSINATISRLAQIMDTAIEYGHVERNVARGKKRKLRQPTPTRPWLEPDQVAALLDAAGELDNDDRSARRPLLATLAWAGLRISEANALRWRDVNLSAGTIAVRESKTDPGVREVDVQPELHDELVMWRATTPLTGEDELVFPTRNGTPRDRHGARKLMLRCVEQANQRLQVNGKPPLPDGLSPHSLRRSYASWLIAEGEDPAYVMQQIGHTDPKVTLGIYARAIRNGRRSVRSQRRLEALSVPTADALVWAPAGSSEDSGTQAAVSETVA